jgi:AraC-like DNA-binding protein
MYAHMPIIRDIIYGAVSRGASLSDLCLQLGIESNELNDSDKRIDFKKAYHSWELAVKASNDPLLGLHLGESTNPSILGLIGHLMQSSPTLLQAFQTVCQHSEVATDMFEYRTKEKNGEVLLQFIPAALWMNVSPDSARHAMEQAMAGTLHVFYLLSGKKFYPVRAEFNYKRKHNVREYERVFQSPLTFNSKVSQLIFYKHQLDATVLSYDKSLYSVFDKMLREKKEKQNDHSTVGSIRQLILNEFKGQVPPIEILASRLNLTTRSLQRRLADENTSFRDLTAELREEVATQLLASRHVKVSEVARLLGYSEASSFRRAYKNWKGNSPSQIKTK